MSSVAKGNRLEEQFYGYLLDQRDREDFVYGMVPAGNCKIYRKKRYYDKVRESEVEFDVVLEIFRSGSSVPCIYLIFECKNYEGAVPEIYVNDFAAKIERIFHQSAKGVLVTASPLQSGAEKVARNLKLGIVKYDQNGFEVVADRRTRLHLEQPFLDAQIIRSEKYARPLKFCAYDGYATYVKLDDFLKFFVFGEDSGEKLSNLGSRNFVKFKTDNSIKSACFDLLSDVGYEGGAVDLASVCSHISVRLNFCPDEILDEGGNLVLGSAYFDRRTIEIYTNNNKYRERFTVAHEVGHFCLNHECYLISEYARSIDLLLDSEFSGDFAFNRIEVQANIFASYLLLPPRHFEMKVAELRSTLDIRDRGHGYIFVDDQPCNFTIYDELISRLSEFFEVSKRAVEIRLKKSFRVNDQRNFRSMPSISDVLHDRFNLKRKN